MTRVRNFLETLGAVTFEQLDEIVSVPKQAHIDHHGGVSVVRP